MTAALTDAERLRSEPRRRDEEQKSSVAQPQALMQAAGLIEADDDEDGSDGDYDDPSLLSSPPFRLMVRT